MDILNRLRRKLAVRRLRLELARWGIDTSDMTDEQIAERATEVHRAMAEVSQKIGLTADEFMRSCVDMGRVMREVGGRCRKEAYDAAIMSNLEAARLIVEQSLTYNTSLAYMRGCHPRKVVLSEDDCLVIAKESPYPLNEVRAVFESDPASSQRAPA